MKDAAILLALLGVSLPCDGGRRHSLTLADDGRLCLSVWKGDEINSFFFDATDLAKPPRDLVMEIGSRLIASGA